MTVLAPAADAPPPPARWWGKVLYALLFCLALPAALAVWAHFLSPLVPWPLPQSVPLGGVLIALGLLLILGAFAALRRHGRGLPMNAFPPPEYVVQGPYRLTRHPIYVGFSLTCLGAAIAFASPGGFWFVTPIAMLGSAALVWGFERPDLLRRFGPLIHAHTPLLHLAGAAPARPTPADRLSIYLLILLPWMALYTLIATVPTPPDAFVGYLPFERNLPVLQWTELIYGSTYLMVLLVPVLARTQRDLAQFARAGLASMVLIFPLYLLVPVLAPSRAFVATNPFGQLLLVERQFDGHGANACPSYHVVWALLAAVVLARRGGLRRMGAFAWALAIAASCVTTGQHALVDVVAGLLAAPLILAVPAIYRAIVRATQRLANSFRARHLGPLRVINHGLYSGLAAGVGIFLIGTLTGPAHVPAVGLVGLCCVVGAGLWAQIIEGSPRLLRPFGYYGAIVGCLAGAFAAPLLGSSTLLLLAAFSTAAPLIQAIGRLRCIVQGCCHGAPLPEGASADLGYRVTNPSSRVCKLSPFKGVAIHPAPLYSILGNLFITLPLARLWVLHARLTLLIGLYLILAGVARFIEEAYRGEPQTRRFAGLPEYQWYAIVCVVGGAVVTVLPLRATAPEFELNWPAAVLAAGLGLFTAFAMSMDFPKSNRRFARLTG